MNVRHEMSPLGIFVVAFHEKLSRFVIQTALREGEYEEASNYAQNMGKSGVSRPVLLQSVNTDSSSCHVDIRVIYFG